MSKSALGRSLHSRSRRRRGGGKPSRDRGTLWGQRGERRPLADVSGGRPVSAPAAGDHIRLDLERHESSSQQGRNEETSLAYRRAIPLESLVLGIPLEEATSARALRATPAPPEISLLPVGNVRWVTQRYAAGTVHSRNSRSVSVPSNSGMVQREGDVGKVKRTVNEQSVPPKADVLELHDCPYTDEWQPSDPVVDVRNAGIDRHAPENWDAPHAPEARQVLVSKCWAFLRMWKDRSGLAEAVFFRGS